MLLGVLAVLHLLFLLFRSRLVTSTRRELKLRLRSGWLLTLALVIAMTAGRGIALVLFSFISFLALKEYLSLIPTRRVDRRVLFWAYFAVGIQYFWIYIEWYSMFLIFIPIYVFLFLPLRMVLLGEPKDFLRAVSSVHWGLMMTVLSLSHLAYLLNLDPEKNPAGLNAGLILFIVITTEFADLTQYGWTKLIGRKVLLPSIDRYKTREGLLGSIISTTALAYFVAPNLTPINGWMAVLFGMIISLGNFFGDASIASIKRDIGVPDGGTGLPGHGGILDRVDSLAYTAPIFFHVLRYLYY